VAKEEDTGEKKKSPMKLVIILLVVLLLAGGGVVGWMMMRGDKDTTGAAAGSKPAAQEVDEGISYPMDTFVTNLADPGGKRYIKTKITLEYTDEKLGDELKQRLPQLRDVILSLLGSKTLADIQGIDGKIALRTELIRQINQILKTGKIRNLYFTEFVIQ
jgi:flagellar FliL protein